MVPTSVPPRRRIRWSYLFLAALAVLFLGVAAIVLSFRMGGEARALRTAVFAAAPGEWVRDYEFGVGRLPVFLARAGLELTDIDPRLKLGASALEWTDVGIYRPTGLSGSHGRNRILGEVRTTMEGRGWSPIVSVQDGDQTVAVFVPSASNLGTRVRACVLVMARDQMVVVSAQARLEPLLKLASEAMAEHPFLHREYAGHPLEQPESVVTERMQKIRLK